MSQRTESSKQVEFQKSILALVDAKIQTFVGRQLVPSLHYEIYEAIFNVVKEVVLTANAGVSNAFVNYVSQRIYLSLSIGGDQGLNPNIFTQLVTPDELSKGEILLAIPLMLKDTDAELLIRTVKAR